MKNVWKKTAKGVQTKRNTGEEFASFLKAQSTEILKKRKIILFCSDGREQAANIIEEKKPRSFIVGKS